MEERFVALENWFKSHFGDLTIVMSTSADGSPFLCAWQPPKNSPQEIKMHYLPIFYIVVEIGVDGSIRMRVLTYHGRIVKEFIENQESDATHRRLQFIDNFKSLRLCQGICEPEADLQFNSETFSRIYLVEELQWKRPLLRSQSCQFGVPDKEEQVCEKCKVFNTSHLSQAQVDVQNDKVKVDESDGFTGMVDPDVEPDIPAFDMEDDSLNESSKRKRNVSSKCCNKMKSESTCNVGSLVDVKIEADVSNENKFGKDECGEGSCSNWGRAVNGKCPICGQGGFDKLLLLRRHCWHSHFHVKPYSCKYCGFEAVEAKDVQEHCVAIHDKKGEKDDVIESKEELKRLRALEANIGITRRTVWKRSNSNNSRRSSHSKGESFNSSRRASNTEKTELPAKKFCEICCVAYDEEEYDEDQKNHEMSEASHDAVRCPSCCVSVLRVQLNEHFAVDHPELKAAVCLECLKIFSPRAKVSVHFHRCHRDTSSRLCPVCGISTSALKAHMNNSHKAEKPNKLMCAICGNEYASKIILNRHIQFVHVSEKNFKCKFCGQGLKTESHLRMHYRSLHTKVKPYKCKHCSYVAKRPNRIYEHCRDVHKFKGNRSDVTELEHEFERIREFEIQHGIYRKKVKAAKGDSKKHCWLCGKYFEQRERLEVHELTHLELKPYLCSVKGCDGAYFNKRGLREHLKGAHGNNAVYVKECLQTSLMAIYEKIRTLSPPILEAYNQFKIPLSHEVGTFVQCSKCDKESPENVFVTVGHFYNHVHDRHGGELKTDDKKNLKSYPTKKLICKICDLETMSAKVLERHILEVHKFDLAAYESYVRPPVGQLEPKIFRPRQYRCKHCFVYTAVKKFTVHRHIKKTHKIMSSTDSDLLPISDKLELNCE